ncbi:uncharacterized protein UV8b_00439 [Ustilaginoidea virens]|uniref:Uncharacterized protein n=1 Tax=Ustilaginoidea virens TaxID=1159556 RepID=A0A1B5KVJ4_USTVR|nr:uncharacterized protein UV8b_00439 [Ustilaginoidea virens]QUC16198.1 hypothetical protein UV8b_00439 [Ustilaginoidea virens]GAO15037.1 hypothetical protein UVI_02027420 [Ustilaginoidea virens]
MILPGFRAAVVLTALLSTMPGCAASKETAVEAAEAGIYANASATPDINSQCQLIQRETDRLFGKPLTRDEYYERNWLWLRCRTSINPTFDAGGSWVGEWGVSVYEGLQNRGCGFLNWHFKYVNQRDWGDVMFGFDSNDECEAKGLKGVSTKLLDMARETARKLDREFHVWNCEHLDGIYAVGTEGLEKAPGTSKG